MRRLTILMLTVAFQCVSCKNPNVKALTESMGQEIIEIGTPVKELPPDIDEEPSAEVDDDDKPVSTLPPSSTTKKETKKTDARRKYKDDDIDDADDARVEKELSEIYKDNSDYKDASDLRSGKVNVTVDALRKGPANFKFQPDVDQPKEVERFRTSVDDISCARNAKRLDNRPTEKTASESNGASRIAVNIVVYIVAAIGTNISVF